jgi:hypothetical protein
MRAFAIGLAALSLTACSITEPVVVIGPGGQTLRGSTTASLSGGSFSATDGKLTCGGTYDALTNAQTITFPVYCSDRRAGVAIATRDSLESGSGLVCLSDGTEPTFLFGQAAEVAQPPTAPRGEACTEITGRGPSWRSAAPVPGTTGVAAPSQGLFNPHFPDGMVCSSAESRILI